MVVSNEYLRISSRGSQKSVAMCGHNVNREIMQVGSLLEKTQSRRGLPLSIATQQKKDINAHENLDHYTFRPSHTHKPVYIYIHVHVIYIYICIYIYMYMYINMCVCVCVRVCIYMNMTHLCYTYVCVCVCVYIYIHIHIYEYDTFLLYLTYVHESLVPKGTYSAAKKLSLN